MPDLEIHSSQTNKNNFGYENCSQNRDEQQFSNHKSSSLFRKINWGNYTLDIPIHRTKAWWKEITRKSPQKGRTPRAFSWKPSAETKGARHPSTFPSSFSLLSLSSFSFFFLSLISYGPRGLKALLALVWSTKEALGGIKTPSCHLNRHTFFSKFSKVRLTGTYTSSRPDGQISSFGKRSSRQALCPLYTLYAFIPLTNL